MSDRTKCLIVVLDKDYRIEDDAQPIINAIKMVKGVVDVTPNISSSETYLAYASARHDLEQRLWDALNNEKIGEKHV